jgi:peptide methionine sulfoxide reductase MsrB
MAPNGLLAGKIANCLYLVDMVVYVAIHTPLIVPPNLNQKKGLPSFTEPVKANVIHYKKDSSSVTMRNEVLSDVCDAL